MFQYGYDTRFSNSLNTFRTHPYEEEKNTALVMLC